MANDFTNIVENEVFIGRRYNYFEGNHGDNYVYHILPESMSAFEKYVNGQFKKQYPTLDASIVGLYSQKIEKAASLRQLCAVPADIKDNLYVVVFTPKGGKDAPFLEEYHTLQYYN